MKRTLLLVFSFAAVVGASFAKTTKTNTTSPFPHFNNQSDNVPVTTAIMRLTGKTKSYFNGASFVPSDSFSYYYKGQQAGIPDLYDLNDDDIKYDSSYTFTYQQGTYANRMKRNQTYANGRVDTLEYHPWKTGDFRDSIVYFFFYTGNIIQQASMNIYFSNGQYFNNVNYTNTIDGQGNVTEMNSANYHIIFAYNSQNLLLTQYDFSGGTPNPVYLEKDSFVYDAQQRVSLYYRYRWDTTAHNWAKNELWNYTYGSNNLAASVEKLQWTAGNYKQYLKQVYTYNISGLRTSDETQLWNSAVNAYISTKKLVWIYNDANLPITLTSYTWNGSSATWINALNDYQVRYWYNILYPASIKTISSIENLSLYPVPATTSVNIHLSWKEMQSFNLTIRDMYGRVVKHWEEAKTADYTKNIPLDNLANGQYFLTIQGENADMVTQKLIVAK